MATSKRESFKPADDLLASLEVGQKVLWEDRVESLEVIDTSFGSHVMLRGPRGAIYRIEPAENGYRLGHRHGNIGELVVID